MIIFKLLLTLVVASAFGRECSVEEINQGFGRNIANLKIQRSSTGQLGVDEAVTTLTIKEGKKFLAALEPHGDMKSTTAFRVEEKVVMTEANLQKFLAKTQSTSIKNHKGDTIVPKWSARDKKKVGVETKTITEYGKSVKMLDKDTGKKIGFRPRFRKYYDYADTGDPKALKEASSIFGNLTAFELKIGGMGGFRQMTSAEGKVSLSPIYKKYAVFKPRIFVTDEIANRLKRLDGGKKNWEKKLQKIEEDLVKMKKADGSPVNSPEKISSMLSATRQILAKEQKLFQPDTTVTYNRTSYKYRDGESEYQFTVDRDVKIYSANRKRKSEDMRDYMQDKPLYVLKEGEVFAELKTPIPVHNNAGKVDAYQSFITNMNVHHIEKYDKGHGKFSIGKKGRIAKSENKLNPIDIQEDGIDYWLARSSGNVLEPLKPNHIFELNKIRVATPFKAGKGQEFHAVLDYISLSKHGKNHAKLDSIQFVDELGRRVGTKINVKDIVNKALETGDGKSPVNIIVNNQKIDFVPVIDAKYADRYRAMLSEFFYDVSNSEVLSRNIADLYHLKSPADLRAKLRYWKTVSNPKEYVKKRGKIFFVGGVMTIGTVVVYQNIPGLSDRFFSQEQVQPASNDIHVSPTQTALTIKDPKTGEPVNLIMKKTEDNQYVALIPEKNQENFVGKHIVEDEEAGRLSLSVKRGPAGAYKYLTFDETTLAP